MPKSTRQHSFQKLFPESHLSVSSHTSSVLLMRETETVSEMQHEESCLHVPIRYLKKDGVCRPSKSISSFDECSKLTLRYYMPPDVFIPFCGNLGQKEWFGSFPVFVEVPNIKWYFRKRGVFHSCECIEG